MGYSDSLTVSYNITSAAFDATATLMKLYPPSIRFNRARIDMVSVYMTEVADQETFLAIGHDGNNDAYFDYDVDPLLVNTGMTWDINDVDATNGPFFDAVIDLSSDGDDTEYLDVNVNNSGTATTGIGHVVVVVTWY